MLSQKTRYAMLALIKLAREEGKGAILSNDIAVSENIPRRYLEAILMDLKKLGILGSRLGKAGGYFLIRKPENISLADVIRHFEGPLAMVPCVASDAYQPCEFCKDEQSCALRKVFLDIYGFTFEKLQKTKLRDLL
jgi:Rrf2 family protein